MGGDGSPGVTCHGDLMCKVIENGKSVHYYFRKDGKFVKQVYRNGKIVEREA